MDAIKKLRSKMLLLNLLITSSVIIAAFGFIFFMTYRSTEVEIQNALGAAPTGNIQIISQNREDSSFSAAMGNLGSLAITGDDFRMFTIIVDPQGNTLDQVSNMDLAPDFLSEALDIALADQNGDGETTLDGRKWRYRVLPTIHLEPESVDAEKSTVSISVYEINSYMVIFLDITSYQRTLINLFFTLLIVGVITLGAIFLISIFFSKRAVKPLEHAWQKQRQFIADASHELKTPVAIINANYDALLANREKTINSQIRWLEYIKIGTDRMTKLTNSLLTLAKIDDAHMPAQRAFFNLSAAAESTLASMQAAIAEKHIYVSAHIQPDVSVFSDEDQVKQIITALLDNAIKYTDENGTIAITVCANSQRVQFTVRNSGEGIPNQELPKLFDRFYRVDRSRTHTVASYGLGLPIAKAIADQLDADIQVQSVQGEYVEFSLRIKR